MPDSPTSERESGFVCDWEKLRLWSVCTGEPFYDELKGWRYCVLHFPGKEKIPDFKEALQRKLVNKDFKFGGVWFPDEPSFSRVEFSATADFREATFNAGANFDDATFSEGANFQDATFKAKANFCRATFKVEANFTGATFSGANFFEAKFRGEANFGGAKFGEASFLRAKFSDYVRFTGDHQSEVFSDSPSGLNLQFARIDKPECVWFQTIQLRPHWFVNIDASKFDFINVDWNWRSIKDEVANLRSNHVFAPHRLLAMVYRRLAANAKENGRDVEASRFRYLAMDARRREAWFGFTFWKLEWWYWAASGYGRKTAHAFLVLIFIWLFFALIYTQLGFAKVASDPTTGNSVMLAKQDQASERLRLPSAVAYSLAVIALQKPDPKPTTTTAQIVVLIETILGPLQAALFFLAVRRKFHSDLTE